VELLQVREQLEEGEIGEVDGPSPAGSPIKKGLSQLIPAFVSHSAKEIETLVEAEKSAEAVELPSSNATADDDGDAMLDIFAELRRAREKLSEDSKSTNESSIATSAKKQPAAKVPVSISLAPSQESKPSPTPADSRASNASLSIGVSAAGATTQQESAAVSQEEEQQIQALLAASPASRTPEENEKFGKSSGRGRAARLTRTLPTTNAAIAKAAVKAERKKAASVRPFSKSPSPSGTQQRCKLAHLSITSLHSRLVGRGHRALADALRSESMDGETAQFLDDDLLEHQFFCEEISERKVVLQWFQEMCSS